MISKVYNKSFFDRITFSSEYSAEKVISLIQQKIPHYSFKSILDVGCGTGVWLNKWKESPDCSDVLGVDGDYLDKNKLQISQSEFKSYNLKDPFHFDQKFDLAQSLEVAEHLPKNSAEKFVKSLVAHSPVILFSAAVPGQGGSHHINEQPLSYWYSLFKEHDYIGVDIIRPYIKNDTNISFWYRYNIIVYVSRQFFLEHQKYLDNYVIQSPDAIVDYSPLLFKFRKSILRQLPTFIVTKLAEIKIKFALIFNSKS